MNTYTTTASSSHLESSPAFQVYPAEFLADERVATMHNHELGAYFRLLCHCWREKSIPCDVAALAKLCGETLPRMRKIFPVIAACFAKASWSDERLVHVGLDDERAKQHRFKELASERGARGAAARWNHPRKSPAKKPVKKQECLKHEPSMLEHGFPIPSPIPITPKASKGAECEKKEKQSVELRSRVGAILARPPERHWSLSEQKALKQIGTIPPEEISVLTRFYRARIEPDRDRRRTNLLNLLRNWSGELDKARVHFQAQETRNSAL